MPQARPLLEELAAADSEWARELLDSEHPESASAAQIREAQIRLEAPLVHTPGVVTIGSGHSSISDSVLVQTLPIRDQEEALGQLLERGASPYVSGPDRGSYLIAASNLRPPTDSRKRGKFLNRALDLVLSPPQSVADAVDDHFRHPLGAVRLNRSRDTRGEAAHLAATLAATPKEKTQVRRAVLGLVGDESVSELWATRALQRLGETMAPDVGFLSGQNWALKSLAAILWSKTTEPEPVGRRLAADPDVRVRRALALNLRQSQAKEDDEPPSTSARARTVAERRRKSRAELLEFLSEDPCFSVRVVARAGTPPEPR